MLAKKQD